MTASSFDWVATGAAAALLSAAVAAIYTWLTYRLVRGQNEPNVIMYVRHDDSRATIIQIVIENIGKGLATDVHFTLPRKLPHRAFGVSVEQAKPAEEMTEGPIVQGIPALGPGDTRKITWGQFGGLYKALGDEVIDVGCTYKSGRQTKKTSFRLDVRSFVGTDAAESDAARINKSLKEIGRTLDGLRREVGRLPRPDGKEE